VEKTIPKGYSAPAFTKSRGGEEMQQAVPAHDYSADERAERARGSIIALLIVAAAAIVIPLAVLLFFVLSR
jgi:hypothetical protein